MNSPALVMIVEVIECNFTEALASRHVPANRVREGPKDSVIMKCLSRRRQDHFLNRAGHTGERYSGNNEAGFF